MAKPVINANTIAFCNEYVANGYKATEAYLTAFPNSKKPSAENSAYRLLRKPEIKDYIKEIQKERFDALNISAERIACELSKLAFSEFDDNNSATSKLKALDLLQKQMGLQNAKIEMSGEQKIVITIGEDDAE